MKKTVSWFLSFVLIFIFSFSVNAVTPDSQVVEIVFKDGESALSDAVFNLYFVGTLSGKKINPTAKFASYPVSFVVSDSEKLADFALTLNSYVLNDDLTPDFTDKTDSNGVADFNGKKFPKGVYLLTAEKYYSNGKFYFCEPVIFILPVGDLETVTIKPKFETEDDSEESTVSYKVIKAWSGDSDELRPKSIKVNLLKDGEIFDTVMLSEENSWKFQWDSLSSLYRWTVSESYVPSGYIVSVSQYGNSFLITNTAEDNEEKTTNPDDFSESTTKNTNNTTTVPEQTTKPELPATGMLLWPIPYLALIGMLLFTVGFVIKRKSETGNE